jgi:phosphatidylglycerol:prolipoprotein diacylglycerol transferase
MYVVGYYIGYRLARWRIERSLTPITKKQLEDLVYYLVFGMLIGARIIYVLVYDFPAYRAHPLRALELWNGGLSFHGAVLGMGVAMAIFAYRERLALFVVTDLVAVSGIVGLFFGRIGNFINGELYGRPSNVPWAMIFPGDPLHVPRHPSQLYEALAEGVVLALVIWYLDRRAREKGWYWPGLTSGAFLIGYSVVRILLEFTREPDAQLGFVVGPFSMGQLLSVALLLAGVVLLVVSRKFQKT